MADIRVTTMSRHEIILATERQLRPDQFRPKSGPAAVCPFCPGNENLTPKEQLEWKDRHGKWKLRVVPNKFPALRIEGKSEFVIEGAESIGIADAHGVHDVLIENPRHDATHATLSPQEHKDILWAIHDRCQSLRGDRSIRDLRVFKNFGGDAGASLEHPHTQIIGLPFTPAEPLERWNRHEVYYNRNGVSIFARALENARQHELIVLEENDLVCYAPYESHFPFELWIMPKADVANFADLRSHFDVLGGMLAETFGLLEAAIGFLPPFNAYIDEAPPKDVRDCSRFYRVRYRIVPRLTRIGGFEIQTGCYINTVPPEQAARRLREIKTGAAELPTSS